MTDSSSMFPIDMNKECLVMPLHESENTSLYVPVIPPTLYFQTSETGEYKRFEPKYLKYYIENCMRIGKVKRIDFATREVPNYKTPQTCAFIHFDCLYDNYETKMMRNNLQKTKKHCHYGFENEHSYSKFGFYGNDNKNAHLLFKINHKPIESNVDYSQNIEQVYANNKILTEKLQEKDEEIRLLKLELETYKATNYEGGNNTVDTESVFVPLTVGDLDSPLHFPPPTLERSKTTYNDVVVNDLNSSGDSITHEFNISRPELQRTNTFAMDTSI